MRTAFTLVASTMLFCGCVRTQQVIPDPTVPHQVAEETEVVIWARRPDGRMAPQKVRLLKGWWVAGPPVVEADPP